MKSLFNDYEFFYLSGSNLRTFYFFQGNDILKNEVLTIKLY